MYKKQIEFSVAKVVKISVADLDRNISNKYYYEGFCMLYDRLSIVYCSLRERLNKYKIFFGGSPNFFLQIEHFPWCLAMYEFVAGSH